MNNQVQVTQTNKPTNSVSKMTTFLTGSAVKQKINAIVGTKDGDKLISNLVSNIQQNPTLAECTQGSIVNGALAGHALKLDFALQQAYLVPFNDRKSGEKVATFMISWRGYMQLALRSGDYQKINVCELKEGELKKFDRLSEVYEIEWIEDEFEREKKESTHYIAYFELNNGFKKVLLWKKDKMELHAQKYSMMYQSDLKYNSKKSFWSTNFDDQAKKTLIRQLISKWGPMSTEMQTAYTQDMATIDDNGNPTYVDNVENNLKVDAEEVVVDENPTITDDKVEILCRTIISKGLNVVEFINSKGFTDVKEIKVSDYQEMIKELS